MGVGPRGARGGYGGGAVVAASYPHAAARVPHAPAARDANATADGVADPFGYGNADTAAFRIAHANGAHPDACAYCGPYRAAVRLRKDAAPAPAAGAAPRGDATRGRRAAVAGRGGRRNPPLPLGRAGHRAGGVPPHEDSVRR